MNLEVFMTIETYSLRMIQACYLRYFESNRFPLNIQYLQGSYRILIRCLFQLQLEVLRECLFKLNPLVKFWRVHHLFRVS